MEFEGDTTYDGRGISTEHKLVLTSTGNWPYCDICCGDRGSLEPEEFSRSSGGGCSMTTEHSNTSSMFSTRVSTQCGHNQLEALGAHKHPLRCEVNGSKNNIGLATLQSVSNTPTFPDISSEYLRSIDPRHSSDTKRNACYFSLQYSHILSQL